MGTVARQRWSMGLMLSLAGLVACLSVLISQIWKSRNNVWEFGDYFYTFAGGLGTILMLMLTMFCLDMLYLDPSDSLTVEAYKDLYKSILKLRYYGERSIHLFKSQCADIKSQQEKVLLNHLKMNADTSYGRDYNFDQITSVQEFCKNHPLCTYEHFCSYIDRVCDGEKNVLTKADPLYLGKTSGTTGKPKRIPYCMLDIGIYLYVHLYLPVHKGAKLTMGNTVVLGHKPKVDDTKSGLKSAPLSYLYRQHIPFQTSPKCVFELTHENTASYIHALFAFKEREVTSLGLLFAQQAYSFFNYAEQAWLRLCNDIEHGTITTDGLVISDELHKKIQNLLTPDKKRADELRPAFKKGSVHLAKRVWPKLQFCRVTTTGSFEIYTKLIQESYLKDVILVPNGYGASEGLYGLNISEVPGDPNYTLFFPSIFFEFILEQNIEDNKPTTLLAHELEINQNYELVITNHSGLYRYRSGDVIKITGFEKQCPIFQFQYRIGQVLNILGEKTPEIVFCKALMEASQKLNVSIIDYTSCEDIHLHGLKVIDGYTRHYVLFIELSRRLTEEETSEFDRALCEKSEVYNYMRTNRQSVVPMEVIQVKQSTFSQLKEKMIQETQNPQFKMPRALRVKEYLQFLYDNRI